MAASLIAKPILPQHAELREHLASPGPARVLQLDRKLFGIPIQSKPNTVVGDPSTVMFPEPIILRCLTCHPEKIWPQRFNGELRIGSTREAMKPSVEGLLDLVGVAHWNQVMRFQSDADHGARPSEDSGDLLIPGDDG